MSLLMGKKFAVRSNRSIYSLILRLVTTMTSWMSDDERAATTIMQRIADIMDLPENHEVQKQFKDYLKSLPTSDYVLTRMQLALLHHQMELTFMSRSDDTSGPLHIVITQSLVTKLKKVPSKAIRKLSLIDTELSVRTKRALKANGIETIGDLFDQAGTRNKLLRLPMIGVRTISEVETELNKYGIALD